MAKKKYNTGDIINIDSAKHNKILTKGDALIGAEAGLATLARLSGEAKRELWKLIEEEFPGITAKHKVAYNHMDKNLKIMEEL